MGPGKNSQQQGELSPLDVLFLVSPFSRNPFAIYLWEQISPGYSRKVLKKLEPLIDIASIGLMFVPGGQAAGAGILALRAGSFALRGLRLASGLLKVSRIFRKARVLRVFRKSLKAKRLTKYRRYKRIRKIKRTKALRTEDRYYRAYKRIRGRREIRYFGKVSRARSQFRYVHDRTGLSPILEFEDVVDFVNRDEKVRDIILNNLSEAIGSSKFIFTSEEELRRFVFSKDSSAKICKIMELEEADLYLVEGRIFTDYWNMLVNKTAGALMYFGFLKFYTTVCDHINKFYLAYNTYLINTFNEIDSKLSEEKQKDIANTYCMACTCCCSCKEGSCCCSCKCNLVHYTQAWENLRSFIDQKEEDLKKELFDKTINENVKESLLVLFIAAYEALQFFLKTQVKEKYLCVVLKKENIINLYLNKLKQEMEKPKVKVSRLVYEFLRAHRGGRYKYEKFVKDLQKFLKFTVGREYTRKQIMVFINNIAKRYSIRKMTLKLNGERYLYLL